MEHWPIYHMKLKKEYSTTANLQQMAVKMALIILGKQQTSVCLLGQPEDRATASCAHLKSGIDGIIVKKVIEVLFAVVHMISYSDGLTKGKSWKKIIGGYKLTQEQARTLNTIYWKYKSQDKGYLSCMFALWI